MYRKKLAIPDLKNIMISRRYDYSQLHNMAAPIKQLVLFG